MAMTLEEARKHPGVKVFNQKKLRISDLRVLKTNPKNRIGMNQAHLERLKRSIQAYGYWENDPIIINEKFQIQDGHHRHRAALELGVPVVAVIDEKHGVEDIARMKNAGKKWAMEDWMKVYADKGVEDYVRLRQFMDEHPEFTIGVCVLMLTNKHYWLNGNEIYRFEAGDFQIKSWAKAKHYVRCARDFKEACPEYDHRNFVMALIRLANEPEYNHTAMVKKVMANRMSMRPQTSWKATLEMLEMIYNRGLPAKKKLRIEI